MLQLGATHLSMLESIHSINVHLYAALQKTIPDSILE
jgi:hypothetical protein